MTHFYPATRSQLQSQQGSQIINDTTEPCVQEMNRKACMPLVK